MVAITTTKLIKIIISLPRTYNFVIVVGVAIYIYMSNYPDEGLTSETSGGLGWLQAHFTKLGKMSVSNWPITCLAVFLPIYVTLDTVGHAWPASSQIWQLHQVNCFRLLFCLKKQIIAIPWKSILSQCLKDYKSEVSNARALDLSGAWLAMSGWSAPDDFTDEKMAIKLTFNNRQPTRPHQ